MTRLADPTGPSVIPRPQSLRLTGGSAFTVDSATRVVIAADASPDVERVAGFLAQLLSADQRPGAAAPRRLGAGEAAPRGSVALTLDHARGSLGEEGYELSVDRERVTLVAPRAVGLFYGAQTLRQLLPAVIEHPAALKRRLTIPAVQITDAPRLSWRGAMLDVSRHFLGVADVKRFIDNLAFYKINRLHLHLSDDQGWRVEIKSWPELARSGGKYQVGGGQAGYYTQDELRDLVRYAADRFITVVPEFDMPGHTNAALVAYPVLNCDGRALQPYIGTAVGFSTLCVDRDSTYRFVEDVIREVGAITGPWFHMGGDEVEKLTHPQYIRFVERVQDIVRKHGKIMIGWGEIATAGLHPSTIVQHWKTDSSAMHVARGGKIIASPSKRAYLDMKYDSTTGLGLTWAGLIDVRTSYDWDPAVELPGVGTAGLLGVEAPLWAESVIKREDYEYMAFPRLLSIAEIGWTPQAARSWSDFSTRLGAHGSRMAALGINFFRAPGIDWR